MNLRDSFGLGTKLKESIFNKNNQINSIVTTRTWVLSTEWTKYRIWILLKKRWWSSFVWMVDVVLQSARVLYDINKADGDKPLPLLPFRRFVVNAIFSEIFKGRQSILNSGRNSKYPMRYLLWWHKTPSVIWTEAYSEPLQATKKECFCVNS